MGRRKEHTKRKKYTLYNIFEKRKTLHICVHEYCIDCAFHTPQILREARGRGYVVSSSEMTGGKKKNTKRGGKKRTVKEL